MTSQIEIEICTDEEWLGCNEKAEGHGFSATDLRHEYTGEARRLLESHRYFKSSNIVFARGQRMLCHGWNGARFTHRCGGLGTFDHLGPRQVQALERIHRLAWSRACLALGVRP